MNAPPVSQTLGTRPLEEEKLIDFLNRVALPVLSQVRRLANSLSSQTTVSTLASVTLDPSTDLCLANATAGNITITLASPRDWVRVKVVKVDATANTVTVDTTFMGDAVLAAQGDAVDLKSDGTAYY